MVRSSSPESDGSRRWRKRISSRMLRLGLRRQAVGSQADDHALFEQGAVRDGGRGRTGRGSAGRRRRPRDGPRVRPRGEAARTRRGRSRCRGRSASRRCGARRGERNRPGRGPIGSQSSSQAPEVFEELPQGAVAVLQQAQFLGHLGQVGRERQPAGRGPVVEPGRRAVGGVRTEPRPGAGGHLVLRAESSPSQFQAASLVWSPRYRFSPISSAKTTARIGAAATCVPAQAGGRGVGQAGGAGLDARPSGCAPTASPERLAPSRPAAGRRPGGARPLRPRSSVACRAAVPIVKARQLEVGVGVDEPGNDRHVAQVEVAGPFPRGPTQPIRPSWRVTTPSSMGGPSTGKT